MKYQQLIWLLLFGCASIGAIVVNKYVLWKLKFTYPTIYQSWQMLFASFFLFLLHVLGYLKLMVTQETLKAWSPAIILFSMSIYFGSVGLAGLPVPIFCFIQQGAMHVFVHLWNIQKNGSTNLLNRKSAACGTIVACFVTLTLNDDNIPMLVKYKWTFLHCLSNSLYSYYASKHNHINLKEHDKLFLNSAFSILVLLTFGMLTGETKIVFDFPFLYHQHFLIACICSGILGAIIMISYVNLCQQISLEEVRFYNVLFIFIVSGLSFFVFEGNTLTALQVFVIYIGLFSTLYLAYCIAKDMDTVTKQKENTNAEKKEIIL